MYDRYTYRTKGYIFDIYTKNFAEYLKILLVMKIILLNYQNYYVGRSSIMSNAIKNVDIPAISLSVLHNYFDDLTKLFSDLYLAQFFLDRDFNKAVLSMYETSMSG